MSEHEIHSEHLYSTQMQWESFVHSQLSASWFMMTVIMNQTQPKQTFEQYRSTCISFSCLRQCWTVVSVLFEIHINSLNQKTEIMVLKFTSCTPLLYHSYSPTSQGNGFWTCGHVQSWTCGGCVHLCCTGGHVCSQSVGRMGDIPCVPLCHKQLL